MNDDLTQSQRKLAETLNVSRETISKRIQAMENININFDQNIGKHLSILHLENNSKFYSFNGKELLEKNSVSFIQLNVPTKMISTFVF